MTSTTGSERLFISSFCIIISFESSLISSEILNSNREINVEHEGASEKGYASTQNRERCVACRNGQRQERGGGVFFIPNRYRICDTVYFRECGLEAFELPPLKRRLYGAERVALTSLFVVAPGAYAAVLMEKARSRLMQVYKTLLWALTVSLMALSTMIRAIVTIVSHHQRPCLMSYPHFMPVQSLSRRNTQ